MTSIPGCIYKALRHPWLIGLLYAYRVAGAVILTLPLGKALAPPWVMAQPRRDLSLVEAGSELLLRLLTEQRHVVLGALGISAYWLVLVFIGELIISSHILGKLHPVVTSDKHRRQRVGFGQLGRQFAIVLGYWFTVIVTAYLTTGLLSMLPTLVYSWAGEKGTDIVMLSLLLLSLTVVGALRVVCDALRARAIGSECALTLLCTEILENIWKRPGRWALASLEWTLLIAAPALLVSGWAPVLSSTPKVGLGPMALRQCAILAMCTLQIGWWTFLLHSTHGVIDELRTGFQDQPDTR